MEEKPSASRRRFAHKLLGPLTIILGAAETLARQADAWSPTAKELLELIAEQSFRLQEVLEILVEAAQVKGTTITTEWHEDPRPSSALEHRQKPLFPPTESAEQEEPVSALPRPTRTQPQRILVVDDDTATRALLQELLQQQGYQVDLTSTGVEAIDRARSVPPDLILLDAVMPRVGGRQMVTVFREDPSLVDVPIVIVSPAVEETLGDPSAFPWVVSKPIQPRQLLDTVAAALTLPQPDGQLTVLIVDDDEGVRTGLGHSLAQRGYQVHTAASGRDGLLEVARLEPDVVLLDLCMPDIDGMDVLRLLREKEDTRTLPVILLSVEADPLVKAEGLRLGADDYVGKPYSSVELEARIESVLRRKELEYSLSPSTRLPGNIAIERVLRQRVASDVPFALCYADLDNFKAYNDTYGFLKGDGVIHQTARILVEAVRALGSPDDFVGHVGGDDFVVITTPAHVESICRRAVTEFDRVIPLYYDAEARARGYIDILDRYGQPNRFTLMTITLVYVTSGDRSFAHPGQLIDQITELKLRAKQIPGSTVLSL